VTGFWKVSRCSSRFSALRAQYDTRKRSAGRVGWSLQPEEAGDLTRPAETDPPRPSEPSHVEEKLTESIRSLPEAERLIITFYYYEGTDHRRDHVPVGQDCLRC
jgi:DNA-directed RNA polymerase specialized sigma24 family protein